MLKLVVGLVIFLGTHSVAILAPGWRERLVARIGVPSWKMRYSLVSIAGFLLIVSGYAATRADPIVLYQPPFWLRHLAMLLLLPVFPLLLATYLPGRIKAAVKHPTLAAVKVWALAHLLVNGTVADVLLFGSFLAWAVADRISAGKRPQATAALPASAARNDLIAVVGGLGIYALFVAWGHLRLVGVPVMP